VKNKEMRNIATILRTAIIVLILTFTISQLQAYPGRGEDHGQGYDQGNAPGDPDPTNDDPVPIDGGIGILLAGGVAAYLFGKKKKK
jgi:LPXTG-motif cell wall-anchored protein